MPLVALWFKFMSLWSKLRNLRESKRNVSENLPEDVLFQIFNKLPVKSIGQCMSVNKQWCSLLNSPSFISSYNSPKNKRTRYLVLWKSIKELQFHVDDRNLDHYNSYTLPVNIIEPFSFPAENRIAICNGVICIARDSFTLVLWNPFIKKVVILPEPNVLPKHVVWSVKLGFAFDSITNDYKVLKIIEYEKHTESAIEIFSLNHNSWKPCCQIDDEYSLGEEAPLLFNGVLHWLACEKKADTNTILGFDVNAEFFRQIKLPDILERKSHLANHHLIIYEDSSLAVVSQLRSRQGVKVQLWEMKEYGNMGSWTNIWNFDIDNWVWILKLMDKQYFTNDLLRLNREVITELMMEDLETAAVKKIVASHVLRTFEESLVLLDNANAEKAMPVRDPDLAEKRYLARLQLQQLYRRYGRQDVVDQAYIDFWTIDY